MKKLLIASVLAASCSLMAVSSFAAPSPVTVYNQTTGSIKYVIPSLSAFTGGWLTMKGQHKREFNGPISVKEGSMIDVSYGTGDDYDCPYVSNASAIQSITIQKAGVIYVDGYKMNGMFVTCSKVN